MSKNKEYTISPLTEKGKNRYNRANAKIGKK